MSNNILTPKTAGLSPVLTSYDFLKTAAILLMILDHVGYYFFPEDLWFRSIGRMSAPIWFFLIGYARSRDIGPRMWIGFAVLALSQWVVGAAMLPVNILGTMILFRLILDPVMAHIEKHPKTLYPLTALLFVIALPTALAVEYGSVAMLVVMAGYMTRNRESLPLDERSYMTFCVVAAVAYVLYQVKMFFAFSTLQEITAGMGIVGVVILMTGFRPYAYPALTEKLPAFVSAFFRLCGRRSLEIYVLHLLVFKAAVILSGQATAPLFYFHMY